MFSCFCSFTNLLIMILNGFVMSSGIVLPGGAALGWAWPASSSPPPMCQSSGHPWHKWSSTLGRLPPHGAIWHLCCPSGDSPSLVYATTSEKKTSWSDSTISGCVLLYYTSGRGWSRLSLHCKWAMERTEHKPWASCRPGHGPRGTVEPITGWESSGHAESWFCGNDSGPGLCQRRKIETGSKCGGSGATQPSSSWQNGVVWRLHEDRFKYGTVYIEVGTQMPSHFKFSSVSLWFIFRSFPLIPFCLTHSLSCLNAAASRGWWLSPLCTQPLSGASNANNNLMNIHDRSKERRKHRKWEAGEGKVDCEGLKVGETGK